jgi:steroid delta-isomerase-like uncharacterized protein
MDAAEMDRLIELHLAAERAGDADASVAMYTEDVEHDVVGAPHGPLQGREAARGFYEQLNHDIGTESMVAKRTYHGADFCVTEHEWTGTVHGEFLGIPGHGRRVSIRMLHLWEFSEGRISRENLWLDGGTAVAQLSAPVTP